MDKLTKEEINIIKELEKKFTIDNPPEINQESFDLIVDKLIEEDKKEVMWNLCATYSIYYEGKYNYNKIVDYYIKTKDSYYLEELLSFTSEESEHKYIVEEMLKTEDEAAWNAKSDQEKTVAKQKRLESYLQELSRSLNPTNLTQLIAQDPKSFTILLRYSMDYAKAL
jgi:hypothetical protein